MVILYSIDCPRCCKLERLLQVKHIPYKINHNINELLKYDYHTAPVLIVDEKPLRYDAALEWILAQ